mmetsp:Transcript_6602/g.9984  ORF Transcript_6602/g.9984 Transcript_6602/m.9984 type:complete len:417 (-) Transcript_6602:124-1374(-)
MSKQDVELLSIGAGILGVGGGGNTYHGLFRVLSQIDQGKKATVIPPDALPKDSQVASVCFFGAPNVMCELLGDAKEMDKAHTKLREVLKDRNDTSADNIAAFYSAECAGTNALEPIVAACQHGVHYLDADGMGRAFPRVELYIPVHPSESHPEYQPRLGPIVLAGAKDSIPLSVRDNTDRVGLDWTIRKDVMGDEYGAIAAIALPPLRAGMEVEAALVPHTVSLCWRIGRAIHNARVSKKISPVDALLELTKGKMLGVGTVIDKVMREGGFSAGRYIIQLEQPQVAKGKKAVDSVFDEGYDLMEVHFVNEFLLSRAIKSNDKTQSKFLATTPDLISLVDRDTARPFFVDEVKYGTRLAILHLPSPANYRSGTLLEATCPQGFKNDFGDVVEGLEPVLLPYARPPIISICEEYKKKK